jgi:adenylate cyclase
MKRNVEIKARVDNMAAMRAQVEELADRPPILLEQTDTFFPCGSGRLKLRQFASPGGELIYYARPDATGPSECSYIVHRLSDPEGLRETLAAALGIRGVVRKQRTVCFIGQTRVHLDTVEGLGDFVELEVVLEPDQATCYGVEIARTLMQRLSISDGHLVDKAYVDLLETRSDPS